MSLYLITISGVLGLLLGVALMLAGAGSMFRSALLRRILRSNKDGWALTQRGNRYTLDPLTRDSDQNAYRIGDEEEAEWVEDEADRMHTMHGVPFGLALEEKRQLEDIESAAAATGIAKNKQTDGGLLDKDERLTISDIRDRLLVGRQDGDQRTILYCNPFLHKDKIPDIVDLRDVAMWHRHDADSDTPRKSAKNAVEAERGLTSGGGVKRTISYIAAAFTGGILVYMGTSTEGGGSVSVPVSVATDALLGVL